MMIESFTLATEAEADEYLKAVLEKPEYRSMGEIEKRAHDYIKDPNIKNYFIQKAREMLRT